MLWLRSSADGADLRLGQAPSPPDLIITTDTATFGAMAVGLLDPAAAVADGRVAITGEPELLSRFFAVYRLPAAA